MSIEALKEQARRHEQKEEWQKALDQYQKAILKLAEDDQPDIGLYNRVGDLSVRVGKVDQAVVNYEKAIDLYVEAYLPNNAIAICKKVIRNLPDRHSIYLKMGQVRAEQGFIPEARTNFLTYAERMQQAGELDESFRALVEFCDLAPDEVEVRLAIADQMASHERVDEGVAQLATAYQFLMSKGDVDTAAAVEAKARELDPTADLGAGAPAESGGLSVSVGGGEEEAEVDSGFGDIQFGGEPEEPEEEEEVSAAVEAATEEDLSDFSISLDSEAEGEDEAAELPMMSFDSEDEGEEEAAELPMMSFDSEDEDEEEAAELPMMSFDSEDEGEEEAAELPTMSFDSDDEEDAAELPTMSIDSEQEAEQPAAVEETEESVDLDAAAFGEADHGDREIDEYVAPVDEMEEVDLGLTDFSTDAEEAVADAIEESVADTEVVDEAPAPVDAGDSLEDAIAASPDDVALRQRKVESAYQAGDDAALSEAYLGLAQALERSGEDTRAVTAYRQVLDLDPENAEAQAALGDRAPEAQPVKEVASHEEYVDLGSMLLGDDEEKSTRMTVAYEEPSGDEEADFAKMLSQFKDKVSENLDADDVRAHHDLGTAYKEMGLLDEAISEFQQALRASADHLPTHESLGQTFLEIGQPEAAVRALERALEVEFDVEDELIGIYYYLARAHEQLGNKDSAVEFYDRVFSLDINFADVTERLRVLR
jgi:tetratricopeptide (TPR) repeat protein